MLNGQGNYRSFLLAVHRLPLTHPVTVSHCETWELFGEVDRYLDIVECNLEYTACCHRIGCHDKATVQEQNCSVAPYSILTGHVILEIVKAKKKYFVLNFFMFDFLACTEKAPGYNRTPSTETKPVHKNQWHQVAASTPCSAWIQHAHSHQYDISFALAKK